MSAVGDMSGENQRARALRRANAVRTGRSKAKVALKRGERTLGDLLDDEVVQGMKLYDLLEWLPVHGPSKAAYPYGRARETAKRLLRVVQASPQTTVRALTERQRGVLLEAVARMRQ